MIKPIFKYTGNKFSRYEQIKPYFASADTVVEPFGGPFVTSMNALNDGIFVNARYNDNDQLVSNLFFNLVSSSTIIDMIKTIDSTYSDDENGYNMLKNYYNRRANDPTFGLTRFAVLYCLICRSFNNQIRFNKSGQFNLSFGERNRIDIDTIKENQEIYQKFGIGVNSCCFSKICINIDDFVYLDPPYINSVATYNSGWDDDTDKAFYRWAESLKCRGIKFMITNTLKNRGKFNDNFNDFLTRNSDLDVIPLAGTYNNSSYFKSDEKTVELLVKNY